MLSKFEIQTGMILILAILIIATVLVTAVLFSNLIIREILQSRLIDQSIQAYYLAESGAERALQQVRRREAIVDCALINRDSTCQTNSYCSLNNDIPCVSENESNLPVRAGWQVAATNEQVTSLSLAKGESFQIDLFNPYQSSASNINEVRVDSTISNLSLYAGFTNLTNILKVGVANCDDQPPVFKDFIQTPASLNNLGGRSILAECSYTFRLNYPLDSVGDSSVIEITVYNKDLGAQLPIPSRLVIDSQAIFGSSGQKVRVKTPMRPPLSGLYDFVLFSEEEIIK